MIKHGQVVTGETPSVVGGRPATDIVSGEPVVKGETLRDPGLVKLAEALAAEYQEDDPDA